MIVVAKDYRSDKDEFATVGSVTFRRVPTCVTYQVAGVTRETCRNQLFLVPWADAGAAGKSAQEDFAKTNAAIQACWNPIKLGDALPDCWQP